MFLDVQRGANEPLEPRSKAKLRPGLGKLVEAIRADEVEEVICFRFDRLFRSARLWLQFLEICKEHSVSLQVVGMGRPIPKLFESVLEYWAAR